VFTEYPEHLPEPLATIAGDPLAMVDLLALVRRRAVARVNMDNLLLHRIPAALLRAASPVDEPASGWAALVTNILWAVTPQFQPWEKPESWPLWQVLLPHMLVVTNVSRAPDTADDEDVDGLLDGMGYWLLALHNPCAARKHLERVYIRRRRRQGIDHPDTLTSATNLAQVLRERCINDRARELDEDTLDRKRRVLGEDHPSTLMSAKNLATDLRELGQFERARELDQRTLDRSCRVLGMDHPVTLDTAGSVAVELYWLGEFDRDRRTNGSGQRQSGRSPDNRSVTPEGCANVSMRT
jgi:hypothetical protein